MPGGEENEYSSDIDHDGPGSPCSPKDDWQEGDEGAEAVAACPATAAPKKRSRKKADKIVLNAINCRYVPMGVLVSVL